MSYQYNKNILNLRGRYKDRLVEIYGVGITRSYIITIYLGIGKNTSISYINRYFFELACAFLSGFSVIDNKMSIKIMMRLQLYFDIKLYKGLRLKRGLPIHGQRTHSNAGTSRRLKINLNEK